eukprot:2341904-Prymnesium_polylepis.1
MARSAAGPLGSVVVTWSVRRVSAEKDQRMRLSSDQGGIIGNLAITATLDPITTNNQRVWLKPTGPFREAITARPHTKQSGPRVHRVRDVPASV